MKRTSLALLLFLTLGIKVFCQPCGVAQSLSSLQQSQIASLMNPLDTALKYENLYKIDSLSTALKSIYSTQGGIPDAVEPYYALVSNINWINITNAINLSRTLIGNDSMVYVNLWKTAKGMNPPTYLPHSLFLRSSAEIAAGLLKIADKETDSYRKMLYQSWATRALDSLATMQIQTGPCAGAFPFPDLRTYNDPLFGPMIQNFMFLCGSDSINVLQNGWIINDKGTGQFKFDAGVIANAYYEAYNYTGNVNYKNIVISIANYLKPLKFDKNYNYNTFVSLGLTRAYQLNNDMTFLDRATKNIRFAVSPGQIANGRWVDGHNANSRYHSIIIQNIVPTMQVLSNSNPYKGALDTMTYKAVKNLVNYSHACNSATGYRWLMKAYQLNTSVVPQSLKDSVTDLIGKHINQSAVNGKYLDVPTMGEYIELLSFLNGMDEIKIPIGLEATIFPNPTNKLADLVFNITESNNIVLSLYNMNGQLIKSIDQGQKPKGTHSYQIDLSNFSNGVYILTLQTNQRTYSQKIIKLN